jgi:hypothetical protein
MAELNKIHGARQIKDGTISEAKLDFSVVKAADYVVNETPAGTIDGTNVTFTTVFAPEAGSLTLFLNGLQEVPGVNGAYTISGSTITFNAGCVPIVGDVIRVSYLKA